MKWYSICVSTNWRNEASTIECVWTVWRHEEKKCQINLWIYWKIVFLERKCSKQMERNHWIRYDSNYHFKLWMRMRMFKEFNVDYWNVIEFIRVHNNNMRIYNFWNVLEFIIGWPWNWRSLYFYLILTFRVGLNRILFPSLILFGILLCSAYWKRCFICDTVVVLNMKTIMKKIAYENFITSE